MDCFLKCFLLFALCVMTVECNVLGIRRTGRPSHRRSENQVLCSYRMGVCGRLMENSTAGNVDDLRNIISNFSRLDAACYDMNAYLGCQQDMIRNRGCNSTHHLLNYVKLQMATEYICREDAQLLMLAASRSPCLENRINADSVYQEISVCGELQEGEELNCPAVNRSLQCALNVTEARCGVQARDLLEDALYFALFEYDYPIRYTIITLDEYMLYTCLSSLLSADSPSRRDAAGDSSGDPPVPRSAAPTPTDLPPDVDPNGQRPLPETPWRRGLDASHLVRPGSPTLAPPVVRSARRTITPPFMSPGQRPPPVNQHSHVPIPIRRSLKPADLIKNW